MELKPGLSALVTGGASGIGKALCLALAKKGIFVTIVDFSEESGRQVASLVEKGECQVPLQLRISICYICKM
ncbi:hypothetical protein CMV_028857 [Castanea mollissima]|uniref:Uncharacterized protein n=1 Tax=Castanea mollissima TaxID=60419 RepID=A0A8J4QD66_9ROSI|nr:hypothetical protein CMV_028857 [Castanea mollissima]